MTNGLNITVKGDKLLIEVDISKKAVADAPMSNSGKNKKVATTGGFTGVPGRPDIRVGLNVIANDK
jgi:hypothetical protein